MRRLRSWLFVPGHKQRMVDKASGLGADVAIFDLEDGVPPSEKETARDIVKTAIASWTAGSRAFVRTHPVGHQSLEQDLNAVLRKGLNGIVLPKVQRPEDLGVLDALLSQGEEQTGMGPGSVTVLATIESARGLINGPVIADASTRLLGLMFGAEDYALDLGLSGTRLRLGLDHARASIAVAAASAGVQAVDKVFLDVRDVEGLLRETREARGLGFDGKALIHPDQVDPVNLAFRPSEEEAAAARRIVAAFEEQKGAGPITVDGKMVDQPVVEQARSILKDLEEDA